MPFIFQTERLSLHALTDDDAPWMFRLLNEPSFIQFIGDKGIKTLEDAKKYISERAAKSYEKWGYGLYGVKHKVSGEFIGICGLVKREALDDPDVGFAFFPEHWSQGYAVESATGALTFARDRLKLSRVLGVTALENQASIRVLEKIGLRFERLIRFGDHGPESRLFSVDFKSKPRDNP